MWLANFILQLHLFLFYHFDYCWIMYNMSFMCTLAHHSSSVANLSNAISHSGNTSRHDTHEHEQQ